MEPTVSAVRDNCIELTDPMDPRYIRAWVEFDVEHPLEIVFRFENKNQHGVIVDVVKWVVARPLVVDGLAAIILTGLGDFKCRSNADRFIIKVMGTHTISLPRDQVEFVITEAEALQPIDSVQFEINDADLEEWLS